jgi:hypothetical protein
LESEIDWDQDFDFTPLIQGAILHPICQINTVFIEVTRDISICQTLRGIRGKVLAKSRREIHVNQIPFPFIPINSHINLNTMDFIE